jgi:arylsulfatase
MLGTRGIWQDGWKAAALHAPISGKGHFDQDKWELYHVDSDRAEARNVAEEHPEKLEELIKAWFAEAEANFVLPLDDRTAIEQIGNERPSGEPPRSRYIYFPDTSPVPESTAVSIRGRSYKILADVDVTAESEGVIFAHGSRFGGHTLFIKDGKLHYVYNFLGIKPEQTFVSETLEPGKHTLGVEFVREGAGEHMESLGTTKLYVGEEVVAQGPMRAQIGPFTLCGDGLCVGYDSADPVSRSYPPGFPFKNGTILGVAVDIGEDQYLDLEREAAAAFARD